MGRSCYASALAPYMTISYTGIIYCTIRDESLWRIPNTWYAVSPKPLASWSGNDAPYPTAPRYRLHPEGGVRKANRNVSYR